MKLELAETQNLELEVAVQAERACNGPDMEQHCLSDKQMAGQTGKPFWGSEQVQVLIQIG